MLRNPKKTKEIKTMNDESKLDKEEISETLGESEKIFEEVREEKSAVIAINRVTKVVKGGKRFSFNALVVVGDGHGMVGAGLGKSNELQSAIQKATTNAKKKMFEFPIVNDTVPHEVEGYFGAGHVWMKPAVQGTGIIAGGGVRAVLEVAGIKNILAKNLGSRNAFNSVYATIEALKQLKSREEIMKLRGKE